MLEGDPYQESILLNNFQGINNTITSVCVCVCMVRAASKVMQKASE